MATFVTIEFTPRQQTGTQGSEIACTLALAQCSGLSKQGGRSRNTPLVTFHTVRRRDIYPCECLFASYWGLPFVRFLQPRLRRLNLSWFRSLRRQVDLTLALAGISLLSFPTQRGKR